MQNLHIYSIRLSACLQVHWPYPFAICLQAEQHTTPGSSVPSASLATPAPSSIQLLLPVSMQHAACFLLYLHCPLVQQYSLNSVNVCPKVNSFHAVFSTVSWHLASTISAVQQGRGRGEESAAHFLLPLLFFNHARVRHCGIRLAATVQNVRFVKTASDTELKS